MSFSLSTLFQFQFLALFRGLSRNPGKIKWFHFYWILLDCDRTLSQKKRLKKCITSVKLVHLKNDRIWKFPNFCKIFLVFADCEKSRPREGAKIQDGQVQQTSDDLQWLFWLSFYLEANHRPSNFPIISCQLATFYFLPLNSVYAHKLVLVVEKEPKIKKLIKRFVDFELGAETWPFRTTFGTNFLKMSNTDSSNRVLMGLRLSRSTSRTQNSGLPYISQYFFTLRR